jgi:hypothetical protein
MSLPLLKALVALVPASMLLCGSLVNFFREKDACSLLQVLGAGCMGVVVITHVFEALSLFPGMHWGQERSLGHYVDLGSALLGLTLFPTGYLLQTLKEQFR